MRSEALARWEDFKSVAMFTYLQWVKNSAKCLKMAGQCNISLSMQFASVLPSNEKNMHAHVVHVWWDPERAGALSSPHWNHTQAWLSQALTPISMNQLLTYKTLLACRVLQNLCTQAALIAVMSNKHNSPLQIEFCRVICISHKPTNPGPCFNLNKIKGPKAFTPNGPHKCYFSLNGAHHILVLVFLWGLGKV